MRSILHLFVFADVVRPMLRYHACMITEDDLCNGKRRLEPCVCVCVCVRERVSVSLAHT